MKTETDVLVIGGGAIGVCSAYYLSKQGRAVAIVEKGDIGSGSSYGNAGLIVPSHSTPLAEPGMISKGIKWMFNPESPFYIKPRFSCELISWLWKFWRACSKRQMNRSIPVIRDLKIKLPIQPAKGYSVTFKRPPGCSRIPFVLAEAKVALTPLGDALRFAGTLELAGLDLSINMRRVQAILKAVPGYLPDIHPENLERIEIWRGLRPCTPDGLPFLGRPMAYDNLILAAGHAMIGISLSPITGKLVSQLAANERPLIDLAALNVERFDRAHTGGGPWET